MKLINSKYEIIEQEPGIDGIYEAIEQAGRTCYKSVGTRYFKIPLCGGEVPNVWHDVRLDTTCPKVTHTYGSGIGDDFAFGYVSIANKDVSKFPDLEKYECERTKYHQSLTAKEFVDRMVKSGHHAMLEFGTVYLIAKTKEYVEYVDSRGNVIYENPLAEYKDNPYSKVGIDNRENYCVSTNYRVLVENGWLDDLRYLCEPTEYHEKRVCVRFTTDVGVSRELNRHRVNSPAEQSTRYCNFSKDKFGNELSIMIPPEFTEDEIKNNEELYKSEIAESYSDLHSGRIIYEQETRHWKQLEWWIWANRCCELAYMNLIRLGWKPQQARRILPLDLQTELNHCAFISDWKHFFKLRDDKAAHPDMQLLAKPLHEEFIKRGYIKN